MRLCIFNMKSTLVDEAWCEVYSLVPRSAFHDIVKLERVMFENRQPRIDMWVRGDLGPSLVRYLREMTREHTPSLRRAMKATGIKGNQRSLVTSGWRMAIWQSWQDWHPPKEPPSKEKLEMARPQGFHLVTFNVNGFPSKHQQVIQFLEEEQITVCVIQETLVLPKQYPVVVQGYNTFVRPWQEGFRGMAVLVDDRLAAYEITLDKERVKGSEYLICYNFLPFSCVLPYLSSTISLLPLCSFA